RLGIALFPQDGSGVQGDCAALALSTAVEPEVPDYAAARERGIPIVHRSELLAHFALAHRAIAVAGTSGKSTVVGMIFEILRGAALFGFGPDAAVRAERLELGPAESRFEVQGVAFRLPAPGRHNVLNALAAIAACRLVGVELREMVAPLAGYAGVSRRFQSLGTAEGIEVVDDFAHNPAKLRAAIATARARARRVLAIFQPHGYGPTRF